MRRISATLLATTIVSLAAAHPSAAAPAKAFVNFDLAKAEPEVVTRTSIDLNALRLANVALVPVYRVDRARLLLPRGEVAMHRHGGGDRIAPAMIEQPLAVAPPAKITLGTGDDAKEKLAARRDLAARLERPVAPVLTGLLFSAYA